MTRGITEKDVWQAADALLLEGARPTIERVRQKIGRGSPNTVSPFLETWFRHLGGRIKDPQAFSAPPGIPEAVQKAAKHFWEVALADTRRDFDERLRDGMAAAVANVEAEKERATTAEAAAYKASARLTRAEADLAERAALLEQERVLRAGDLARLEEARRQMETLAAKAREAAADTTRAREEARRDVATAQERAAAFERRAALEIDAERVARQKAEKRAEAADARAEAAQAQARDAEVARAEVHGRLQLMHVRHEEHARRLEGAVDEERDARRRAEGALGDAIDRARTAEIELKALQQVLAQLRPARRTTRAKEASA
jgi:hypothetical protein